MSMSLAEYKEKVATARRKATNAHNKIIAEIEGGKCWVTDESAADCADKKRSVFNYDLVQIENDIKTYVAANDGGDHSKIRPSLPLQAEIWSTPRASQDHKPPCDSERRRSPALNTQASMYPTPTASPYGSNVGGGAGRVGKVRPSLSRLCQEDINTTGSRRGYLNPRWVALLMGLPDNWLEIEDAH